ncbi:hypothetical protein VNI00_015926 [Paramarasmius palmivorus]|uniref:Uncharacterized protein n=1 Tax=Paramarasmius palmivorus TaxID=297713 RepID=A0AAW0BGG5_9AGAR
MITRSARVPRPVLTGPTGSSNSTTTSRAPTTAKFLGIVATTKPSPGKGRALQESKEDLQDAEDVLRAARAACALAEQTYEVARIATEKKSSASTKRQLDQAAETKKLATSSQKEAAKQVSVIKRRITRITNQILSFIEVAQMMAGNEGPDSDASDLTDIDVLSALLENVTSSEGSLPLPSKEAMEMSKKKHPKCVRVKMPEVPAENTTSTGQPVATSAPPTMETPTLDSTSTAPSVNTQSLPPVEPTPVQPTPSDSSVETPTEPVNNSQSLASIKKPSSPAEPHLSEDIPGPSPEHPQSPQIPSTNNVPDNETRPIEQPGVGDDRHMSSHSTEVDGKQSIIMPESQSSEGAPALELDGEASGDHTSGETASKKTKTPSRTGKKPGKRTQEVSGDTEGDVMASGPPKKRRRTRKTETETEPSQAPTRRRRNVANTRSQIDPETLEGSKEDIPLKLARIRKWFNAAVGGNGPSAITAPKSSLGLRTYLYASADACPELLTTSREIALTAMTSGVGNLICRYHTINDKGVDKSIIADGLDGVLYGKPWVTLHHTLKEQLLNAQKAAEEAALKQGFLPTPLQEWEVPGWDRVKSRDPRATDCGCVINDVLLESYLWKTGELTSYTSTIVDSWGTNFLTPRQRALVCRQYREGSLLDVDDLYPLVSVNGHWVRRDPLHPRRVQVQRGLALIAAGEQAAAQSQLMEEAEEARQLNEAMGPIGLAGLDNAKEKMDIDN